jgi:hypothetical protein
LSKPRTASSSMLRHPLVVASRYIDPVYRLDI